jgi:[acyl-carrier-protein] S-malonyltransferase
VTGVGTSTGLLFPGQGVQAEGMGEPWRDSAGWKVVDTISDAAGMDVEGLLLSTPAETLRRTDRAQVAVFTTAMIALADVSAAGGLEEGSPCAGHSVGEYAALVAAGALSLTDGARLVAARGRAMLAASERSPGTMAAVMGGDAESVAALAADATAAGAPVWAANFNAPGQVVVSGTLHGVSTAAELAAERGMKAIRLKVGGAFHSPLMASAAEELGRALHEVQFARHHASVVANVDARPHTGDCDWRDLLVRQLTSPVRWEGVVRCLARDLRCGRLLELGTGKTLAGMVRRITKDADVRSVNSPSAVPARSIS